MEMLGVEDLIVIPAKGEEIAPEHATPERTVEALSLAKASEVAKTRHGDDIIVAADTIVWVNDRVFGKPHSREQAFDMLRTLSGRAHEVYTGVTVIAQGRTLSQAERSVVHFRELTQREIEAYVDTGEPMDKAGAYGAQGLAALFVRAIEGDFFNVMGLPLCRLGLMLKEQGVELL